MQSNETTDHISYLTSSARLQQSCHADQQILLAYSYISELPPLFPGAKPLIQYSHGRWAVKLGHEYNYWFDLFIPEHRERVHRRIAANRGVL